MKLKNRKSIRLKNYDYSNNGYYFVTICVQNKLNLMWNNSNIFSGGHIGPPVHPIQSIINESPYLNQIGEMVNYWWNEIPNHFQNIKLDESVIMPNHVHGIIIIKNSNTNGLGKMIQWFKTMTTNKYIKNVRINNVGVDRCVDPNCFMWPRFNKRLWQRNYYERIIRNDKEYFMIKNYIKNNPKNWQKHKP